MTKVNLASEAEIISPLDLTPARSRMGHGRHMVRGANAFPDMLDEIKTKKSVDAVPAFGALEEEAAVEFDGDVDADQPHQKIDVDDVPDEVVSYMQKLAVFMQMPVRPRVEQQKSVERLDAAENKPTKSESRSDTGAGLTNVSVAPIPQLPESQENSATVIEQGEVDKPEMGPAPADNPLPVRAESSAQPLAGTLISLMDKITSGNFEVKKTPAKLATLSDNDGDKAVLPKPQFLMKAPVIQREDPVNGTRPELRGTVEVQSEPLDQAASPPVIPADVEPQVLKVETSFPPAAPQSLLAQFSRAIAAGLEGFVPAPLPANANVITDPRRDLVKNLQLRLHPADLGEIKVGMHLRGGELHLKIEVTTTQVETILQNDRQVLRELIGKAGYDISEASILISCNASDASTPVQRQTTTFNPAQDASVGQGSRQHPGAGPENRNQFQNPRGSQPYRPDFDGDNNGKISHADRVSPRRDGSVFI